MPYLETAQLFLEQSRLLISARPTTARISTKYTLPNLDPSPSKYKPKSNSEQETATSPRPETSQTQPPKTTLTLKTYDPVSGTCLKYKTEKAAEVGRLVAALSSCGRLMAALPDKEDGDIEVEEVVKEEPEGKTPETKFKAPSKEAGKISQTKGGERGGGGGKKKKGKK